MHAFFCQAKKLAELHQDDNIITGYMFNEKIDLLETDLKKMGSEIFEGGTVFTKLNYHNHLGFCYVPFGSMLGGQMIYKKLLMNKPSWPLSFYGSCNTTIMAEWREFVSHLLIIREQHHPEILNGAKISYLYFLNLCSLIK